MGLRRWRFNISFGFDEAGRRIKKEESIGKGGALMVLNFFV